MNSFLPSRRILLEAVVLVTVAATAGLSLNYQMVMKAFSGRSVPGALSKQVTVESSPAEAERFPVPVDYAELDSLLADGAVLVDARDADYYQDSHLPGALSLPLGDAGQGIEALKARVPLEHTLITYCNGFGCPDSFDLGLLLLEAGYAEVLVYEGGFPEWRDQGRPLESGAGQ